jgi:hypothetical protein
VWLLSQLLGADARQHRGGGARGRSSTRQAPCGHVFRAYGVDWGTSRAPTGGLKGKCSCFVRATLEYFVGCPSSGLRDSSACRVRVLRCLFPTLLALLQHRGNLRSGLARGEVGACGICRRFCRPLSPLDATRPAVSSASPTQLWGSDAGEEIGLVDPDAPATEVVHLEHSLGSRRSRKSEMTCLRQRRHREVGGSRSHPAREARRDGSPGWRCDARSEGDAGRATRASRRGRACRGGRPAPSGACDFPPTRSPAVKLGCAVTSGISTKKRETRSHLSGLGGTIRECDPGHGQVLQTYDDVRIAPVGPGVTVGLGIKRDALQIPFDVAA